MLVVRHTHRCLCPATTTSPVLSLPIEDFFSRSSDPYCTVRVGSCSGGFQEARTNTVAKNLNPKWAWTHTFRFPLASPPTHVHFSVWDHDIGSSDDPLGSATLDLTACLRGGCCVVSCVRILELTQPGWLGAGEEVLTDGQGWVDLQHCKTGRLRVHVQLKQHGEQPDLPWPRDQPWLSTIRCRQLPAGDTDLKLKVLLRPNSATLLLQLLCERGVQLGFYMTCCLPGATPT